MTNKVNGDKTNWENVWTGRVVGFVFAAFLWFGIIPATNFVFSTVPKAVDNVPQLQKEIMELKCENVKLTNRVNKLEFKEDPKDGTIVEYSIPTYYTSYQTHTLYHWEYICRE